MSRIWQVLVVVALALSLASAVAIYSSTGTLDYTGLDSLQLDSNLKVGNGTPTLTLNGEDAYVEGTFEVDGAVNFAGTLTSGAVDLNGADLIIDADADSIIDEVSDDNIRLTSGAATGLWNVLLGNFQVGNGTPGVALNGEDAYIEGTLEVDGAAQFDGIATFVGDPVLGTAAVSAGEIADATHDINIPLESMIDCQTDAGARLDFSSGADVIADFINSATDGTGFTLTFDDTGATEDQSSEVCGQVRVPADWISGGTFRTMVSKDAHAGATEVINCAVSINGAALLAAGTVTTSASAATAYSCVPTLTALAANDSLSFYLSITSATTMDDTVNLHAVSLVYTAAQ